MAINTVSSSGVGSKVDKANEIDTDDVTIEFDATLGLRVKALGIDTAQIANGAVDSTKLSGGVIGVEDSQVLGSDTTEIEYTGLAIGTAKFYILHLQGANGTGNNAGYRLYFNGDETDTNYYMQLLSVDSTTVSSSRSNSPVILQVDGNVSYVATINIYRDQAGFGRALVTASTKDGSAVRTEQYSLCTASVLGADLTTIKLKSDVAGSFETGTKLDLYKGVL